MLKSGKGEWVDTFEGAGSEQGPEAEEHLFPVPAFRSGAFDDGSVFARTVGEFLHGCL